MGSDCITLNDTVISHSPVYSFNLHTHMFLDLLFLTWKHDGCFIPQLGQLLQSSKTPDLISGDKDEDEFLIFAYFLLTCI